MFLKDDQTWDFQSNVHTYTVSTHASYIHLDHQLTFYYLGYSLWWVGLNTQCCLFSLIHLLTLSWKLLPHDSLQTPNVHDLFSQKKNAAYFLYSPRICIILIYTCTDILYLFVFSDKCKGVRCDFHANCENGICVCPTLCPTVHEPVCTTDGKFYTNECEMRKYSCDQRVSTEVLKTGGCDGDALPSSGGRHIFVLNYAVFFKYVALLCATVMGIIIEVYKMFMTLIANCNILFENFNTRSPYLTSIFL